MMFHGIWRSLTASDIKSSKAVPKLEIRFLLCFCLTNLCANWHYLTQEHSFCQTVGREKMIAKSETGGKEKGERKDLPLPSAGVEREWMILNRGQK
jgi:hypothetical protein